MALPPDTRKDLLRRKLFPVDPCPLPEAPSTYADVINIKTSVELSFGQRLRVMLTGRLRVETKTVTENRIGQSITASSAYALPWKFLENKIEKFLEPPRANLRERLRSKFPRGIP